MPIDFEAACQLDVQRDFVSSGRPAIECCKTSGMQAMHQHCPACLEDAFRPFASCLLPGLTGYQEPQRNVAEIRVKSMAVFW
ncbi:hypothetical protein K2X14_02270 [Acetobacter sp. TBRC 12305]|uniref:Uncharacterized protein n=1 Tax=Acetobacter garciniae TaxID=2817435 RepID=A0A939KPI0_9PROT|nr:hypothetical protein [Acetobacter garciniae]MBO1323979.1 hypothetical protein [Acetobacter garciniae]MBX0343668.1 hypothetical protein [Acetobacter garciniae]